MVKAIADQVARDMIKFLCMVVAIAFFCGVAVAVGFTVAVCYA